MKQPITHIPHIVWSFREGRWQTQEVGGVAGVVRQQSNGYIFAELLRDGKTEAIGKEEEGCPDIFLAVADATAAFVSECGLSLYNHPPGKGEYIYAFHFDEDFTTMVGRTADIPQRAKAYLKGDRKRYSPVQGTFLGFNWIGATYDSERAEEQLLDHPGIMRDRRGTSEAFDCGLHQVIEAGMQVIKAYPVK